MSCKLSASFAAAREIFLFLAKENNSGYLCWGSTSPHKSFHKRTVLYFIHQQLLNLFLMCKRFSIYLHQKFFLLLLVVFHFCSMLHLRFILGYMQYILFLATCKKLNVLPLVAPIHKLNSPLPASTCHPTRGGARTLKYTQHKWHDTPGGLAMNSHDSIRGPHVNTRIHSCGTRFF